MRSLSIASLTYLAFVTACVTINGKSYPSSTRFTSEQVCQPGQSLENLRVVVNDWKGKPLAGAKVRAAQEPNGAIDGRVVDREGAAVFSLAADNWQVSVRFPGFNSANRSVRVGVGQVCVVTFYLRRNEGFDPDFFSKALSGTSPEAVSAVKCGATILGRRGSMCVTSGHTRA